MHVRYESAPGSGTSNVSPAPLLTANHEHTGESVEVVLSLCRTTSSIAHQSLRDTQASFGDTDRKKRISFECAITQMTCTAAADFELQKLSARHICI